MNKPYLKIQRYSHDYLFLFPTMAFGCPTDKRNYLAL